MEETAYASASPELPSVGQAASEVQRSNLVSDHSPSQLPFWKQRLGQVAIGVFAVGFCVTGAAAFQLIQSQQQMETGPQESTPEATESAALESTPEPSPTASASATPSPTAPTAVIKTTSTKPTPVPTQKPIVVATPKIDILIDNSWPYREGGSGAGCTSDPTRTSATYCEVRNPNYSVVFYTMILRNSGSATAQNIVVRTVLNGKTQEQTVDSIAGGGTKQVNVMLSGDIGQYTAQFTINPNRSPAETNYNNNTATFTYEIKPDQEAPFAKLDVRNAPPNKKCFSPYIMDNIDWDYQVSLQLQVDDGPWKSIPLRSDPSSESYYEECYEIVPGVNGHLGRLKATDRRGNTTEVNGLMLFN
jgi:hypothetical protein